MDVVSLPMYDLPEVRPATTALLGHLAHELALRGWPVQPTVVDPSLHGPLIDHWRDGATALSQSCGLPVIEHLADEVTVLGTFVWSGVSDGLGRYRSLVVVPASSDATGIAALAGRHGAVNDPTSLSGWCSLGVALARHGAAHRVSTFSVTGSHASSLDLLRSGGAAFAAIDPATFALLRRHRPAAVQGVRVVGEGPTIPATPLVTRRAPPIALRAVRAAAGAAVDALAPAHRATLGIERFSPLTAADYGTVGRLVRQAERALPRTRSVS